MFVDEVVIFVVIEEIEGGLLTRLREQELMFG